MAVQKSQKSKSKRSIKNNFFKIKNNFSKIKNNYKYNQGFKIFLKLCDIT